MTPKQSLIPLKQVLPSLPWFTLGMTGIFLFSLVLRFWGLGRFNTFVFDEVYYAKFANNYLTGTHFFNAHPPLSQYFIAIGIWIGSHLPIGQDTVNGLTGSVRSTFSYRWLNALTGSFIPLVVGAVAYQLNHRRSYALIAACFAALDGLFLVESRYALNNVYLVILGLLGQLYLLIALRQQEKRKRSLILSGIFFGASACIKWNGLWFLFGAYLVWAAVWVIQWQQRDQRSWWALPNRPASPDRPTPLQNLTQIKLPQFFYFGGIPAITRRFHHHYWDRVLGFLFYFGVIPVITYSLLWIPHLIMNPTPGFFQAQKDILVFHEKIGSGASVHPYCSRWYTWILMIRPVAYFYETARNQTEIVPVSPPLPADAVKVVYDVHAIGNPFLWWLSTAAILLLAVLLIVQLRRTTSLSAQTGIPLYLVLNWLANLLPWVRVTRCTFLYHYMGSSVFAALGLAWLVDRWLDSDRPQHRNNAIVVLSLILLAFLFWLPIYLGLPLSPFQYRLRMWFPTWI